MSLCITTETMLSYYQTKCGYISAIMCSCSTKNKKRLGHGAMWKMCPCTCVPLSRLESLHSKLLSNNSSAVTVILRPSWEAEQH